MIVRLQETSSIEILNWLNFRTRESTGSDLLQLDTAKHYFMT